MRSDESSFATGRLLKHPLTLSLSLSFSLSCSLLMIHCTLFGCLVFFSFAMMNMLDTMDMTHTMDTIDMTVFVFICFQEPLARKGDVEHVTKNPPWLLSEPG